MARPDSPDVRRVALDLQVGIRLFVRQMRQMREQGLVPAPQLSVLSRLDRDGDATANELARAEQMSPQSMGAIVAALAGRGLVERRPDPTDRRRLLLTPTTSGVAVLRERRDARTERLEKALAADFTPAELRTLRDAAPLLERLAQRF